MQKHPAPRLPSTPILLMHNAHPLITRPFPPHSCTIKSKQFPFLFPKTLDTVCYNVAGSVVGQPDPATALPRSGRFHPSSQAVPTLVRPAGERKELDVRPPK